METKAASVLVLRRLLRALARLLLRTGVTAREAERLLRDAMVETAFAEFGLRGRPTNVSRVAMLTGLDRREVARVRDRLAEREPEPEEDSHPLGQVLAGWRRDPAFSRAGEPEPLPVDGGERSFAALAARYAPGLPPVAVRKELERVDAVETEDGRVRLRGRYYLLAGLAPRAIGRYGQVATDLLGALNHNVLGDDPSRPRFEGRAQLAGASPATAEAFRRFLDERGQSFLEEIDAWLAGHADEGGPVRLGAGLYLIHDEREDANDE